MSDPFAIRLDFLALLRRLTASQQSIHRILTFAARNASAAADDIWDCILAECSKASLNARINILFLVDSLICSHGGSDVVVAASLPVYLPLIRRDLLKLVGHVAPDTRDGMRLNAGSVQRLLDSWRAKRALDLALVDEVQRDMEARRAELENLPSTSRTDDLSRAEVLRRIEEDRERHKLLREGRWILPPKSFIHAIPGHSRSSFDAPLSARSVAAAAAAAAGAKRPAPTSSANPSPSKKARVAAATATAASRKDAPPTPTSAGFTSHSSSQHASSSAPDAHDVEFEALWEATSDLNDDDLERIREEDGQWWGGNSFLEEAERKRLEKIRQETDRVEREAREELERIAREEKERIEREERERKEAEAALAAAKAAAAKAAAEASARIAAARAGLFTPAGGARRRGLDPRAQGISGHGDPRHGQAQAPSSPASWSSSPQAHHAAIPTGPRHHQGGAPSRPTGSRAINSASSASGSGSSGPNYPHPGSVSGQSSSGGGYAHTGSGGGGGGAGPGGHGPQTPHHGNHQQRHSHSHSQQQQQRDMTPPTGPSGGRNWSHHGGTGSTSGGYSGITSSGRRRGTPPTGPRWGGR